jgi:hypothetical protein
MKGISLPCPNYLMKNESAAGLGTSLIRDLCETKFLSYTKLRIPPHELP